MAAESGFGLWHQLVELGVVFAVEHSPARDDVRDRSGVADVLERVAANDHQIRKHVCFHTPDLIVHTHHFGGMQS